jgi:hypothetical protein
MTDIEFYWTKDKLQRMSLDIKIMSAEYGYVRSGMTQESKHRMSKEIAQEIKELMGDRAYLHCLEKLSNNTPHPKLWRDVLYWLDEGETNGTNGVVSDQSRSGCESEKHEPSGG